MKKPREHGGDNALLADRWPFGRTVLTAAFAYLAFSGGYLIATARSPQPYSFAPADSRVPTSRPKALVRPLLPTSPYLATPSSGQSTWKTYADSQVGYAFKYPEDWTLHKSDDGKTVTMLPIRYYLAAKDQSRSKDGTVPDESLTCSKDAGTVESYIRSDVQNGFADDLQEYTLPSGVRVTYYIRTPLWDVKTFDVSHNGYLCELTKPTTDASPLTKQEDSQGDAIIYSFTFTN